MPLNLFKKFELSGDISFLTKTTVVANRGYGGKINLRLRSYSNGLLRDKIRKVILYIKSVDQLNSHYFRQDRCSENYVMSYCIYSLQQLWLSKLNDVINHFQNHCKQELSTKQVHNCS